MKNTEKDILDRGVNFLIKFGYSDVTKDNIFTDKIYSEFFKRLLLSNIGYGSDNEIKFLLNKINQEE